MTKNTNDLESLLKVFMKRTEKEKQDYIVELYRENNDLKRWNETLKSIAREDKKIIDSLREKNNILANNIPYPKGGREK
jgi:thermostable 8-oxoguanine DNA glycosylase